MRLLITFIALILSACMNSGSPHNLSTHELIIAPSTQVVATPSVNWKSYKNFAVIPFSSISETSWLKNGPMEQHMMFAVRNHLESRGYDFVNQASNPDLLLLVDAKSEYKTNYVPPSTITIPKWVPGETVTSVTNSSGVVNVWGDVNAFGNYSGSSTTSTYIPGYSTTESLTRNYFYRFNTLPGALLPA